LYYIILYYIILYYIILYYIILYYIILYYIILYYIILYCNYHLLLEAKRALLPVAVCAMNIHDVRDRRQTDDRHTTGTDVVRRASSLNAPYP